MTKLLTEAELELMRVLWSLDEATAREVLDAVDRALAYTTVSTILRILVEKGFVATKQRGRAHAYRPIVGRSEYQVRKLRHVLHGVFDGSPISLVRRLVDAESLSTDEVAELRALVDGLDEPHEERG